MNWLGYLLTIWHATALFVLLMWFICDVLDAHNAETKFQWTTRLYLTLTAVVAADLSIVNFIMANPQLVEN